MATTVEDVKRANKDNEKEATEIGKTEGTGVLVSVEGWR